MKTALATAALVLFLTGPGCNKKDTEQPAEQPAPSKPARLAKAKVKASKPAADPVGDYIAQVRESPFKEGVLAQHLLDDYYGNTIAADKRYKGCRMLVVGVVARVSKSLTGKPYVALVDSPTRIVSIRCNLSSLDDVDDLQANKVVRVFGKVTAGNAFGVTMDGCRIVSKAWDAKVEARLDKKD